MFRIVEKERNHYSNLYGKIVDGRGNVVVAEADADMKVPRGGKFIPAPMRYFMRFNGATGMHAGYLPGYPASHACVRLPENNAIALFQFRGGRHPGDNLRPNSDAADARRESVRHAASSPKANLPRSRSTSRSANLFSAASLVAVAMRHSAAREADVRDPIWGAPVPFDAPAL